MGSVLAFVLLFVFNVAVNEEYNAKLDREMIQVCKKYDSKNITERCQGLASRGLVK